MINKKQVSREITAWNLGRRTVISLVRIVCRSDAAVHNLITEPGTMAGQGYDGRLGGRWYRRGIITGKTNTSFEDCFGIDQRDVSLIYTKAIPKARVCFACGDNARAVRQ